ncbi:hypothetical protein GF342_06130 [Candidatus Woesearchaeota archaeon]|nr:hypothetical protein [Candidatus Woesearchaeota archaeon]
MRSNAPFSEEVSIDFSSTVPVGAHEVVVIVDAYHELYDSNYENNVVGLNITVPVCDSASNMSLDNGTTTDHMQNDSNSTGSDDGVIGVPDDSAEHETFFDNSTMINSSVEMADNSSVLNDSAHNTGSYNVSTDDTASAVVTGRTGSSRGGGSGTSRVPRENVQAVKSVVNVINHAVPHPADEQRQERAVPGRTAAESSLSSQNTEGSERFLVVNGVKTPVIINESLLFSVRNTSHSVTILNYSSTTVTLLVQSAPQYMTLAIGQTVALDVTDDGIDDVQIHVESLQPLHIRLDTLESVVESGNGGRSGGFFVLSLLVLVVIAVFAVVYVLLLEKGTG